MHLSTSDGDGEGEGTDQFTFSPKATSSGRGFDTTPRPPAAQRGPVPRAVALGKPQAASATVGRGPSEQLGLTPTRAASKAAPTLQLVPLRVVAGPQPTVTTTSAPGRAAVGKGPVVPAARCLQTSEAAFAALAASAAAAASASGDATAPARSLRDRAQKK
jgi:hypothetical protein